MHLDTQWPLIPIVLVVTIIIASIYRYYRYRRKLNDQSRNIITGVDNTLDYIHNPVRVKPTLDQPVKQDENEQRNDSATSMIEIIATPLRPNLNSNDHILTDDSNSNVEPSLDNTPPYQNQFQEQFHHYHLPHERVQQPQQLEHQLDQQQHDGNHQDHDEPNRQPSPPNPHYESLLQSVPTTNRVLYYGKISVREPLAKILAERQSYGDYEDLEVYNERGSSCFYEEIAGSTTSSVTYDQIGNQSLQNYRADH